MTKVLLVIAFVTCGDNSEPKPVPTCKELGCDLVLCEPDGGCSCAPDGHKLVECTFDP